MAGQSVDKVREAETPAFDSNDRHARLAPRSGGSGTAGFAIPPKRRRPLPV